MLMGRAPVRLEIEETFIAPPAALHEALTLLWPADGLLCVGEIKLQLQRLDLSTYVHLYHSSTNSTARRRLKLGLRGGSVVARSETKIIQPGGKLLVDSVKWRKGEAAVDCVRQFGSVCAAFAKRRATLKYAGESDASLIVGIDRVIAFDPGDIDIRGAEILYLEFEGATGGLTFDADAPNALLQHVGRFAHCAAPGEAKWEKTRAAEAIEARLLCDDVDAARGLLARVSRWFGQEDEATLAM